MFSLSEFRKRWKAEKQREQEIAQLEQTTDSETLYQEKLSDLRNYLKSLTKGQGGWGHHGLLLVNSDDKYDLNDAMAEIIKFAETDEKKGGGKKEIDLRQFSFEKPQGDILDYIQRSNKKNYILLVNGLGHDKKRTTNGLNFARELMREEKVIFAVMLLGNEYNTFFEKAGDLAAVRCTTINFNPYSEDEDN